MELQEFVTTALVQIVQGVAKAREDVAQFGAAVGSDPVYGYTKEAATITDDKSRPWTKVEFDILLTEATGTATRAGIGVFLGAVGLGAQGTSQDSTQSHSPIKFAVPG